jgi:hypothetical protein
MRSRKSVPKIKCEEILMNWKTLLVIASLSLTTGLTACNKEAAAPDATKTETKTETTETKPADGAAPKVDATKPADAPKGDAMKPADAPKGDATKPADGATKSTTTKTETTKPADAPKKP